MLALRKKKLFTIFLWFLKDMHEVFITKSYFLAAYYGFCKSSKSSLHHLTWTPFKKKEWSCSQTVRRSRITSKLNKVEQQTWNFIITFRITDFFLFTFSSVFFWCHWCISNFIDIWCKFCQSFFSITLWIYKGQSQNKPLTFIRSNKLLNY